MRRFFGKGGKQEVQSPENPTTEDAPNHDLEETQRTPNRENSDSERKHFRRKTDNGGGDAGAKRPPRPHKNTEKVISSERPRRSQRHLKSDEDDESSNNSKRKPKPRLEIKSLDDTEDDNGKFLKPKPRPRPKPVEPSTSQVFSEDDSESDVDRENIPAVPQRASNDEIPKTKRKKEKGSIAKGQSSSSLMQEQFSRFINKDEVEHLLKIEPTRGGHYVSSTCSYKRSAAGFKLRVRLLKYPTFSDHETWPGDFAVVEERVFGWQEKVFSASEAKKYHKLESCITEQEKEYHEKIANNPESIGKFLFSYISNDSYVIKKREKYLIRRCPVPHIRKSKNGSRFSVDGKGDFLDGASIEEDVLGGEVSASDSIDFDEPISSSTPKTKRKEDKAKSDLKDSEKKLQEKESKDQERKTRKIQEAKEKREKDEETKKKKLEAKQAEERKKIKELEDNEKERKKEYMKKYKYSKRPSLALGARLRSVQLTPSPRKLSKKQKSHTVSRSSEFSTDFQEEERDSESSTASKAKTREPDRDPSRKLSETESPRFSHQSRRVGHEHSGRPLISTMGSKTQRGTKGKGQGRINFVNSETMYIMASVPQVPGRSRDLAVCMIRNVPSQGILVFKPPLGYRNIEAKRNHVYRISCEQDPSDAHQDYSFAQDAKTKDGFPAPKSKALDDFVGLFELVPKNELRVTVLGEITTAEAFDSSPLCVYYVVDIPKGWRNESVLSHMEGITHTSYTDYNSVAHFSHEFSFHLSFSMDSVEAANSYPNPVLAFMVVSMTPQSPRIIYEGYGYLCVPMTPGTHYMNVRTWKPRPRTILEKMRATFLNVTPSLQDMKFAHISQSEYEDCNKANLIGLQTEPSGLVKFRLHVLHQSPTSYKDHEKKLDMLEKMSSATILKSVQAVIEAFQRAREKAADLKNHYDTIN